MSGNASRARPQAPRCSFYPVGNRFAAGAERDSDAGTYQYLRWHLPSGRVKAIDAPADLDMMLNVVNRHGVIGGWQWLARPSVIVDDQVIELPVLDPGVSGSVDAVGSNGEAAGYSMDADDVVHPVTWRCS